MVGCVRAEGRWPDKGALEFKRSCDRVRLNVPGKFDSLTMLAWLRIDGFDRQFNSLLLCDEFSDGHAHWQVKANGMIDLGVKPRGGKRVIYLSEPVLGQADLGRWLQLAVVYDVRKAMVSHYLDGRTVGSMPLIRCDHQLQLGPCEIGNWSPVDQPPSAPIRNFNGRMDEFAIFKEALGDEEILALYELGRPS